MIRAGMQCRLGNLRDYQLTLCFARKSAEYDDGAWLVHKPSTNSQVKITERLACYIIQGFHAGAACQWCVTSLRRVHWVHSVLRPVTSFLSTCTQTIIRTTTSRGHRHPPMSTHIISRIKAQSIRCPLHHLHTAHLCQRTRTNMTSAYSHNSLYMCQVP